MFNSFVDGNRFQFLRQLFIQRQRGVGGIVEGGELAMFFYHIVNFSAARLCILNVGGVYLPRRFLAVAGDAASKFVLQFNKIINVSPGAGVICQALELGQEAANFIATVDDATEYLLAAEIGVAVGLFGHV